MRVAIPKRLILLLLLASTTHGAALIAEEVQAARVDVRFPVIDLEGNIHQLGRHDEFETRVFVFLSTECPISNRYTQTLNELQQLARARSKFKLFGVVADRTLSRASVAAHYREFEAKFPIIFDQSEQLTRQFQPTHVPEAFVLNADEQLVYRGAIDDTWTSVGRSKAKPSKTYLLDSIRGAIAGTTPAITKTKPVGCLFESFSMKESASQVTYTRDIAPIIYARCVTCHREGQVAPFPLATYEQVAKRADWIASVTEDRIMPPWIPHPGHERFVDERWLTDTELSLLKTWAESGRARGNESDLPAMPKFADGWRLGEPDLVVKMPEPFTVYPNGPDLFQNFVIPVDIPEDKMVAAVEFHPGNKRVVHHSVLFLDSNGVARKLDEATPEPGYSNFGGPGFAPTGALGGWSVGNTARRLPNGMGRYLKKGSDLVMQIHYHPTGKEEIDQSEVGLYFIDKPVAEILKEPAKLVGSIWMANYQMDIPAGESHYPRSSTYTLPKDVILVGIVPHMHLLGKSMKVTATLPDAKGEPSEKILIDIREWNYNWQDEYYYERPFELPAGTKLTVDAVFDNSESNPSNPSSPPQRVTWGEETDDEMLFCFFLLSAKKSEDLIHVIYHNLQHDMFQPRSEVANSEGAE